MITHGRDVPGLFGKASDAMQAVRDEQAAKGRRAAGFFQIVDKALDHEAQEGPSEGKGGRAEERWDRRPAGTPASGTRRLLG